MKYDEQFRFSLEALKMELHYTDIGGFTFAELIGLYLLNEISEAKLKELTNITTEELENLALNIIKIKNKL